jgi:hypothetical protein
MIVRVMISTPQSAKDHLSNPQAQNYRDNVGNVECPMYGPYVRTHETGYQKRLTSQPTSECKPTRIVLLEKCRVVYHAAE